MNDYANYFSQRIGHGFANELSVLFGVTVKWTQADGTVTTWEISGANLREAQVAAFALAVNGGWTPKRWWQWWRWDDTPAPADDILDAAIVRAVELQAGVNYADEPPRD